MDLNSLISGNYLWIAILIPGFITLRIYYLFIPEVKRTATDSILSYASITLTVAVLELALLSLLSNKESWGFWADVLVVLVLLGVPVIVAMTLIWSRSILEAIGAIHHSPKAWDGFFSKHIPCYVKFHLKDGRIAGGTYSLNSRVSSFPHDEDIYVEEEWNVDQETGRFLMPVENSCGMLVKHSECVIMEFFHPETKCDE